MEVKKNGYQTGVASEYLVLSVLYRLGVDAYMTMGNKKSVDIQVVKDDGSSLSIDVKSVRASDSIPVGNVEGKDNHYVIFVIYNGKFEEVSLMPDIYVVSSKYVVEHWKRYELERGGERFNIFKSDIKEYKDKWDLILGTTEKEIKSCD